MARQPINVGSAPNDGTGDPIRDAYTKINANETELYVHADSAHAPSNADNTAANETSHADVIVDGDFSANGYMKRTGAGTYDSQSTPIPVADTEAKCTDATADNTAANETSHADVVVDGDIGTTVQAYDANTAKTDVPQEYTATQNFNATTLVDGVNISWDASTNQVASVTLAGNRTLDNPTNMVDGATYILTVKQDATGSRTLAYGTAYKWQGGTAPTLSTGVNAVDILTFICDGTNMYGVPSLDFS